MEPILWEYHIVFHTCHLGSTTKTVVNPFTKQEFQVPVDDGLSDKDTEALQEIFAAHKIKGPFDGGHLVGAVYGNEWISIHPCYEFGGSKPVSSISTFLIVIELPDKVLKMILRLAGEANLALMSQQCKIVRIVGREPNARELARWPDAKSLCTIDDLRSWLHNQIKGRQISEEDRNDRIAFFSE